MSQLIRVTMPGPDDTQAEFDHGVQTFKVSRKRLIELAMYAPQWAPQVEQHLEAAGLTDAVHWIRAHTKDDQWSVDADIRQEWAALTAERTDLLAEDLTKGAVDVAWFRRSHAEVGAEMFADLQKAATYASSGSGHRRAQLFADALLGQVDMDDLNVRINDKRQQDPVRALGLLPLPDDPVAARTETLARYERLRAWEKGSKKFGQMRRASEGLAVRIGLENLARTAGYRDPQRLVWAMETEAVADLHDALPSVTSGDVTVALVLDDGLPRLAIDRAGRVLKNLPKEAKGNEEVEELRERVRRLKDQGRRMRTSLEDACVRGDVFSAQELADLSRHPILAAQLQTLVLVDRADQTGLLQPGGERLLGLSGRTRTLEGTHRIAHPVDLLAGGDWSGWQRHLFDNKIRQPFRQVFRQLYVPVADEVGGATTSSRYAGHQVQARQAAALWGSRGWLVSHEGTAAKTFHDERITVYVDVLGMYGTPGEVEDATLDKVWFLSNTTHLPVAVDELPRRLFSEAMRDLDLVVSVAHAGGVDPEASASTVQMRAMLVEETTEMLGIENIELTDNHVIVKGTIADYSIHLGSGMVHKRPGGAVCIVPIGAQHRGRVFLPFVDDDPRTAEVVSKVVLLAADDRIQDPTILEQLRQ